MFGAGAIENEAESAPLVVLDEQDDGPGKVRIVECRGCNEKFSGKRTHRSLTDHVQSNDGSACFTADIGEHASRRTSFAGGASSPGSILSADLSRSSDRRANVPEIDPWPQAWSGF
jgi:hypothetical protein